MWTFVSRRGRNSSRFFEMTPSALSATLAIFGSGKILRQVRLIYSPLPNRTAVTSPQCQSSRVRPLLPLETDARPVYLCRDCHRRWEGERRTKKRFSPLPPTENGARPQVRNDLRSRRIGWSGRIVKRVPINVSMRFKGASAP
jgi:transposase-like protein